jgi:hypothetical protein
MTSSHTTTSIYIAAWIRVKGFSHETNPNKVLFYWANRKFLPLPERNFNHFCLLSTLKYFKTGQAVSSLSSCSITPQDSKSICTFLRYVTRYLSKEARPLRQ